MSQSVNDVVVSGRVRLARNYHDLPFFGMSNEENAQLCITRAMESQKGNPNEDAYHLYTLRDMTKVDRQALMEQHLISRDLLEHSETGAALISKDHSVSIMINEEDHLRIQSIVSGLDLTLAANEAFDAEEKLEAVCTFSFDPQLGYLTSCPTNTGTGLRASLMMHLPMLTRFKQMGKVNQSVAKLGLTTRGIYGEGSEALGDLYQISNQVTLGRTEDEIIEAVSAVGKQLIDMEHALRARCLANQTNELKDTIFRSYGILRYAVQMDEKEFMQHWSNLRLGSSLGQLEIKLSLVDELLTTAQTAHVQQYVEQISPDTTINCARCQIIQKYLNPIP